MTRKNPIPDIVNARKLKKVRTITELYFTLASDYAISGNDKLKRVAGDLARCNKSASLCDQIFFYRPVLADG